MPRDVNSETLTELTASRHIRCHLVELELDAPTGTIRMSDAPVDVEYGGQTYVRGGHLLSFTDAEETTGLLINTVTVSLAGVDQTMVALVLQENYLDRPLRIMRAYLTEGLEVIGEPVLVFDGRVNQPAIRDEPGEGGTSVVTLQAASHWVDFERSNGRLTNHELQQVIFPGDLGFEYASEVFKDLPWGLA